MELVSLGITLGISALLATYLPGLRNVDAAAVSFLIFLVWGAVCVAIYRASGLTP